MILHAGGQATGTEIMPGQRCPRCGSKMMRRPCPCPFRRAGWAICAKCVNRKCGMTVGLKKRPKR